MRTEADLLAMLLLLGFVEETPSTGYAWMYKKHSNKASIRKNLITKQFKYIVWVDTIIRRFMTAEEVITYLENHYEM